MSADFIVDPPGKRLPDFLDWMPPRGLLRMVLELVAEEIDDEAVAASLREFVAGGYAFFALSNYSATQAAAIMKVIREKLPAAAWEWFPDSESARGVVEELVEMVEEAEAAPPGVTKRPDFRRGASG
ncbi:hypothetical protein [Amycolatopsis australiensis]|uniref:Uncharacterized protein n=1 Tax=Amycolatopsis australiensis TaxID=546364 RepID=A0A1K1R6Z1_9PSEU|nr:hypothetical protein [Amycolatopsis australiensis]SFW67789.1 hypothetical protein SAMN04489730_2774 [Amycolatopsis australiensis]